MLPLACWDCGSECHQGYGCLLWVLSGKGLCNELITRPEEFYRLWFVVVCDLETSSRMRRPWAALGCCAIGEKESVCSIVRWCGIRTVAIQPEGCGLNPGSLGCPVEDFYDHGDELMGSTEKGGREDNWLLSAHITVHSLVKLGTYLLIID